ncbi:hybrid sensor histidine kinase/response regulator [Desulfosarcina cetonica]|uniref:hybrid sensor histidine kinase/response regulator n=1 Tax=Desulfosarcina cetonica TaxID=90730 RepID=UPI00278C5EF4|nr:PAS domain-containing sensor histidine kinase [Desulfosarcina cetonica]
MFENALEGLFCESADGRLLNANPALAHILEYDSPQALIESVTDVRHQLYVNPEERQVLEACLARERNVIGFETQIYRRNGDRIWVSISARMVLDKAGRPAFIEGFITDISDRKSAEDALAESRTYLDEIINAVADPLFVKDREHRWVLVNNAMCTFMGRPREMLLGKSDYDYLPQHEADEFWAKDELVLTRGETNINEESLTDVKGNVHTLLTKKSLYTDKRGELFIVAIIQDITDLKQAEAEKMLLEARLTQSQKMEAVGTLAGGIAHDFNNILQPIMGYSELLKNSLASEGPQQRYVDRIYQSCIRAKDLVTQILTFSRQSEHTREPVRVQTILKEIIKLSRSTIPSYIEIQQEIQQDCAPVVADPTQLHQIAMNLMINAYHAVEHSGGKITIQLEEQRLEERDLAISGLQPGSYAVLSLIDTGCGIDPAIMDKIFEPYFTTKAQGKGTGLGLSVVYGIVKHMQGDIKVFSEVGKGTTFQIALPTSEATGRTAIPASKEKYPSGTERILLVDDEILIVESSESILSELGYQVTSQSSSTAALECFRTHPNAYDLVITDMAMPTMTGEQLAERLMEINPEIPIIICTGFSEQIGREKAKAIGIKEFLMKPIAIAEMSQKVRNVLDQSRFLQ